MKKWMLSLLWLGYLTPALSSQHNSFLITGNDINEVSLYDHALDTPNFFTRIFPTNLSPNLVIVPRTNSGFLFGLTGALQRIYDTQLDYAIVDPTSTTFVGPGSNIHALTPSTEFNYGAYLGYIFPYTGRDITLSASYLSNSRHDSVSSGGTIWTPLSLYDQTIKATTADATFKPQLGQAVLTLGQSIFGGTRLRLHAGLGAKGVYINRQFNTTYIDAVDPFGTLVSSAQVQQKSQFTGVGPAVSIDGAYLFTQDFGIAGHLLNAIMVGSIKSDIQYQDSRSALENTAINSPSTFRAIPNIDGKLALFYRYPFCGSLTRLDIELGYEVNQFFDATDTFRSAGGILADEVGFITPLNIKQVSSWSLAGPYLSVGVSGISCPDNAIIDPIGVGVPSLDGGIVLGIGAAYWLGNYNQTDFALSDPSPVRLHAFPTLPSSSANIENIQGTNAYAGMVRLGYIFNHTPYDLMLNYQQSSNSHDKDLTASFPATIWPLLTIPTTDLPLTRNTADKAHAKLDVNYYTANLEVGQSINAGSLIWLRAFEGVQAAHIKTKLHVKYTHPTGLLAAVGAPAAGFSDENVEQQSKFDGFGPRMGLDLAVPFGNYALISQLAGGFLIDKVTSIYSDKFEVTAAGLPSVETILGTQLNSSNQVSPFLDMKVAIAYTWSFFSSTKWTVDFGYMATHYFNAVTSFRHLTNNANVFARQVDDITFNGPYLMLTVYGLGACPVDCTTRAPFTVIVPELKGGLEVAAELLFMNNHVTNTDYGMVDPTPITTLGPFAEPSSNSRMLLLNSKYKIDYRLHAGYIFPLTANDLSVNYVIGSNKTTKTTVAPTGGVIWTLTNGNFDPTSSFPIVATEAIADMHIDWHTENLEFGSRIKFHHLMTRWFAGVAYAKLTENIDITYPSGTALDGTLVSNDTISQTNSFSGFGPRLGMAADWNFACVFSLTGLIATDLLVGKSRNQLQELDAAGESDNLNANSQKRFAPEVEAKLGIAATAPLKCSQASLEFGYEVDHYFNVKDSLRFTDAFSSFVKQDQDIGFHGPYLRLQINF